MLSYQLLLGAATLCCAASAGFLLSQAIEQRSTQLLALLMVCGAVWTGCELSAAVAGDAESALFWFRLASTGWLVLPMTIPLLVVRVLEGIGVEVETRWRRRLFSAVALEVFAAGVIFALVWTGTFVIREPILAGWGWVMIPGPGLFLFHIVAMLGVSVSCVAIQHLLPGISRAESIQRPWLWVAIATPSIAIVASDILAPLTGISVPRIGGASLAVTGLIAVWQTVHYGTSVMSPTRFSDEILEVLEDGVALVNVDGTIRRANGGLARISGFSQAELVGMPAERLVEPHAAEGGGLDELRRVLVRAGGARIPVLASMQVLRDRQQNAVGVVVVLRDLRELEDLRRSAITNARLAAVGQLAAGIAHEINNPVAFVGTNLRVLREHWQRLMGDAEGLDAENLDSGERAALVAEGRELIDESLQGVDRTAEIVRGVKRFTHAGTADRQPALLDELLDEIINMARPQLGKVNVAIERKFAPLPPVECSAQELKQVFLNLLINALQAVGEGGHVRVTTARENALAVVSFEDDGCGIAPEVIDRIFDPFFTTKEVGEGTGLGLGIAHQIVTLHGGVITVQSVLGAGATFRVHLPLRAVPRNDA